MLNLGGWEIIIYIFQKEPFAKSFHEIKIIWQSKDSFFFKILDFTYSTYKILDI